MRVSGKNTGFCRKVYLLGSAQQIKKLNGTNRFKKFQDQAKLLLSGWKKIQWEENVSPISPRCSQAQGTIKLM
jgi:hypothetical protein